jgi:glycosyltransferase involved in cell wall biosynthesis
MTAAKQISVLHCYRTYFPDSQGGGEEAIRQIALSTQAQGFTNTVFCLSAKPKPSTIQREEATVERCLSWAAPGSCDLGTLTAFRRFRELMRSADIVHYHFPWPFADLLHLTASSKGKPSVMTYHSDIVRQRVMARLYRPLMVRMVSAMSAVVATSEAYARTSVILRSSVSKNRLRVIPLGIFEQSYRGAITEAKGISLQDRFGLSPNGYFLSLGVLRYYKGLHSLVEAARTLDFPVVIAGDGPMRSELEESARNFPPGRLRFLGFVSEAEKIALMRGCRAFVLPSHLRSEAFGMVLVEAAMLGKPMISCEIGTGTSFVNLNEKTGLVVEPSNPLSLGTAMKRVLNDEKLAADWGQCARSRYEQLFSGSSLGVAYSALYREVLADRIGREQG